MSAVHAQGPVLPAPALTVERQSPTWTWVVLGLGVGLVAGGLGTGVGALVVQGELDGVCELTCPRSYGSLQETGRVLAVSTDVLWLGGLILTALGLAAALTLEEEVPQVSASCDDTGCRAQWSGHF